MGTLVTNLYYTLQFIFPNFYIINLPTIIAIQFLDVVGENIVILYIIDRLWKTGLLLKYHRKYPAVYNITNRKLNQYSFMFNKTHENFLDFCLGLI